MDKTIEKQQKPQLRCDGCKTMCFKCFTCWNNSLTSEEFEKSKTQYGSYVIGPKIS